LSRLIDIATHGTITGGTTITGGATTSALVPGTATTGAPRRPSDRGFSFAEVMLAAVLLGFLMVAAVQLFGNLGRSRQRTLDEDLAGRLCLEMIREIKELDYADPTDGNGVGPEPDEVDGTRQFFDDVDDYNGWTASPPQDREGNPLSRYIGLTRSVTVDYVSAGNFSNSIGAADQGFKRVTITVSRGGTIWTRQQYVIADVPREMLNP